MNAVRKTRYTNRGVLPDREIIQSLSEIMKNKDVQMDYALSLLQSKKTGRYR